MTGVSAVTKAGVAKAVGDVHPDAAWAKTRAVLQRELGAATFDSWLAHAAVREAGDDLYLVAATGVARDWIRRHAWRRICELWAANDPLSRPIELKSKMEFEALAANPPASAPLVIEVSVEEPAPRLQVEPTPAAAKTARQQGLQERFSFDTFVPGPRQRVRLRHGPARRLLGGRPLQPGALPPAPTASARRTS